MWAGKIKVLELLDICLKNGAAELVVLKKLNSAIFSGEGVNGF